MQETMVQLVRIQAVDSAIAVVEGELAKFPGERAALDAEMDVVREEIAAEKATLEAAELEERRVENSMRDQEALIEKLNHQSGQVSSNQAYTALQHELEAAENAKAEFETSALEQMETIDKARQIVAAVGQKLTRLEEAAPVKFADIESRKGALDQELAKQLELRGKECEGIVPAVMSRYDKIRSKKHPAIAVIDGKSCPECKIVLPRMVLSEVNRLDEFIVCTSCKRLLVPARVLPD